jgi:hypothetical protein
MTKYDLMLRISSNGIWNKSLMQIKNLCNFPSLARSLKTCKYYQRKQLAKKSSHLLATETGRWTNTQQNECLSKSCNMQRIETEHHFLSNIKNTKQ